MNIERANCPSPARRLQTVLKVFAVLAPLLLMGYLAFPKIFTGDYADIRIEGVTAAADGKVTLHMAKTASYGTPVSVQIYKDRNYAGGTRSAGGGTFPRRPSQDELTVAFDLNPERAPAAGRFEDSNLFKRLLVKAGQVHHLQGEQVLTLFDFRAADGARYSGFIRTSLSLSAM